MLSKNDQDQIKKLRAEKRHLCYLCKKELPQDRQDMNLTQSQKKLRHKAAAFYHEICWKTKLKEMEETTNILLSSINH